MLKYSSLINEEVRELTIRGLKFALIRIIVDYGLNITSGEPFTLASGEKSPFYFDLKKVMMMPEANSIVGRLILEKMRGRDINAVGGLVSGAIPITAGVMQSGMRAQQQVYIRGFSVLKDDNEFGKRIEGDLRDGDRLLVLEDVSTSGGSALQACQVVMGAGFQCDGVLTILDRVAGARERIEGMGLKFDSILTYEDFKPLFPITN